MLGSGARRVWESWAGHLETALTQSSASLWGTPVCVLCCMVPAIKGLEEQPWGQLRKFTHRQSYRAEAVSHSTRCCQAFKLNALVLWWDSQVASWALGAVLMGGSSQPLCVALQFR